MASERCKNDAVSALRSAVAGGRLLLTEEPLPVRVAERGDWSIHERVGSDDDRHAREMRVPGRVTLQGGFPKSKDGLYFVFIDEGWPGTPGLELLDLPTCRWCAGDGLHPFMPRRHRQMLRRYVQVDGYGLGVTVCMGCCPVRPLRDYLQITAKAGIAILDRFGLELGRICCPRCAGSGSPQRAGIALL